MNEHGDARSDDDATGTEGRLRDSMAGFAATVEPRGDAWNLISARLDDPASIGNHRLPVMDRSYVRPVSIAAAILVVVLVAASTVALTRADQGVDVVTQPAAPLSESIVALTADGRIVELGADGRERRTIVHVGSAAPSVDPGLRVTAGGTAFFTREAEAPKDSCAEQRFGTIWMSTEIVSVPLNGGVPRVVVPVGGSFDISPDGRYLAYAGPDDNHRCLDVQKTSQLSVLDLQTGVADQLSERGSASVGPPSRVQWVSDGGEIAGVPPTWFDEPTGAYPSVVPVTHTATGSQATSAQQTLIASQDPLLLAASSDLPRDEPTMVNPLGVTVPLPSPTGSGDTVDIAVAPGKPGKEQLVVAERTKDGRILVASAAFDRTVRGDKRRSVQLPSTKIADLPGAARGSMVETWLDVDDSGRRILVTVAEDLAGGGPPGPCCLEMGRRPGPGRWLSTPTHTYIIESGQVRKLADGIVAAVWTKSLAPMRPETITTRPTGTSPGTQWSSLSAYPGTSAPPPAISTGTTAPPQYRDTGLSSDKPSVCPPEIAAQMARFEVPAFAAGLPDSVRLQYLAIFYDKRRCDPNAIDAPANGPAGPTPPYRLRWSLYPEVLAALSEPPVVDPPGLYSWGKPGSSGDCGSVGPGLTLSENGTMQVWRMPCQNAPTTGG